MLTSLGEGRESLRSGTKSALPFFGRGQSTQKADIKSWFAGEDRESLLRRSWAPTRATLATPRQSAPSAASNMCAPSP